MVAQMLLDPADCLGWQRVARSALVDHPNQRSKTGPESVQAARPASSVVLRSFCCSLAVRSSDPQAVGRPSCALHTELGFFGIPHHDPPSGRYASTVINDRRSQRHETGNLAVKIATWEQIDVHRVLHRLPLWHQHDHQPGRHSVGVTDNPKGIPGYLLLRLCPSGHTAPEAS